MTSMLLALLPVLLFEGPFCSSTSIKAFPPEYEAFNGSLYASCRMHPNTRLAPGSPKVYGQVLFKQTSPEGTLRVRFRLHGLPDDRARAIHIHQYGDVSNGCTSTGRYYSPSEANYHRRSRLFWNSFPWNRKMRRSVDSKAMMDTQATPHRNVSEGCTFTDGPLQRVYPHYPGDFWNFVSWKGKIRPTVNSKATLFGVLSVIGRAVVIYEKEDGTRMMHGRQLACCVIGISSPHLWRKLRK